MGIEEEARAPAPGWRGWRPHTTLVGVLGPCFFAASQLLCGCSMMSRSAAPATPASAPISGLSGRIVTASWYGSELSGHRTTSGEVFNPNELTAASRSLPIGSRVQVTNVSNGRTVVVRINDRGPYIRGRGIDLSHAAAQRIGLVHNGVGHVQIARADSSGAPPPDVSSLSSPASRWPARSSHGQSNSRRRHRRSRRRIVSNPVGKWILSALPHF